MTLRSPGYLGAFAVAAASLAGCAGPTVVRVIDGRELPGRFVSDRAYALYARGAEAEARGDRASARLDYLAAAAEDDANVEIWTRIGAVTCALGREPEAREAFERAAAQADDYEPLFRERAACVLARAALAPADARAAFEDASRALALDPTSEDAVLLYARAAEAAGETAMAERALRELVASMPGRAAGWSALRAFAARHGDPAAVARAESALAALGPSAPVWPPAAPGSAAAASGAPSPVASTPALPPPGAALPTTAGSTPGATAMNTAPGLAAAGAPPSTTALPAPGASAATPTSTATAAGPSYPGSTASAPPHGSTVGAAAPGAAARATIPGTTASAAAPGGTAGATTPGTTAGAAAPGTTAGAAAPGTTAGAAGGAATVFADVDAALARGSLEEARKAAKRVRLPPAELAVRAAALGRAAIAKAQAELVHRADPSSASAAIALAVACDLQADGGGVVRALADASALTTPPSPLARLLLAELLARRTSADAARAWLGPVAPATPGSDPLLASVTARASARLAR